MRVLAQGRPMRPVLWAVQAVAHAGTCTLLNQLAARSGSGPASLSPCSGPVDLPVPGSGLQASFPCSGCAVLRPLQVVAHALHLLTPDPVSELFHSAFPAPFRAISVPLLPCLPIWADFCPCGQTAQHEVVGCEAPRCSGLNPQALGATPTKIYCPLRRSAALPWSGCPVLLRGSSADRRLCADCTQKCSVTPPRTCVQPVEV